MYFLCVFQMLTTHSLVLRKIVCRHITKTVKEENNYICPFSLRIVYPSSLVCESQKRDILRERMSKGVGLSVFVARLVP